MKLEHNPEEIYEWISRELLSWPALDARIFGSILEVEKTSPNDVDLFIKYKKENISEIVHLKDSIKSKFFDKFGIELHLLVLTIEESEEFSNFLKKALNENKCVVNRYFQQRIVDS